MNTELPGGGQHKAHCVTHPDNLAGGTCSRCGNFLCYVDTEGGRFTTCESCRARTGVSGAFPLNRTNYTFGSLWDHCWSLFKLHWLMLSVGVLIPVIAYVVLYFITYFFTFGAMMAAGSLGGGGEGAERPAVAAVAGSILIGVAFGLVMAIVLGMLMVGFFRMCHDVLDGQAPDIGRMFSVFGKVGRGIAVWLLVTIATYLASAIFFGPSIGAFALLQRGGEAGAVIAATALGLGGFVAFMYVFLPMYLLPQEMAFSDAGVLQLFASCWNMAKEFRWSIVLVMLVFLGLYFAGFLACCIGIIPALALSGLLFTGLHRALRVGAEGVSPQH